MPLIERRADGTWPDGWNSEGGFGALVTEIAVREKMSRRGVVIMLLAEREAQARTDLVQKKKGKHKK